MVLEECPFCHKLFVAEQVSREQVDSNIVSNQPHVFPSGSSRITSGPWYPRTSSAEPPAEDFITYKLTYRCKHCGKEWTKLSEKEVNIPRSYIEDEEERTEYDADKEEEEAREEERG